MRVLILLQERASKRAGPGRCLTRMCEIATLYNCSCNTIVARYDFLGFQQIILLLRLHVSLQLAYPPKHRLSRALKLPAVS